MQPVRDEQNAQQDKEEDNNDYDIEDASPKSCMSLATPHDPKVMALETLVILERKAQAALLNIKILSRLCGFGFLLDAAGARRFLKLAREMWADVEKQKRVSSSSASSALAITDTDRTVPPHITMLHAEASGIDNFYTKQ
eukprot:NODE_11260_length_1298_cov_4.865927.p3 GENE.NODE_11260_length_1298_cov_4.865927~~NODE_11260_length_1298_cov_4.865927.p3  ORF type:complete len:140 (+),score=37.52 NODE_11260_length_1298_cov_4.865927:627-1046(+)